MPVQVPAIKERVLLSQYSTFGIGGPARYLVEVSRKEEVIRAFQFAKDEGCPYLVIGKGSNVLFDDEGFDGLVLINKLLSIKWDELSVEVASGYSFSLLGVQTARKGLKGLEFASGIPATVGGAVFMNAGASGSETFDALAQVSFLTDDLQERIFQKNELEYRYRYSSFHDRKGMILSAKFNLEPYNMSRAKQLEIIAYRTKTQPYLEKSAGCAFRNPKSQSAGALIERCGLKGYNIGGAEVSLMHANFIINKGGASAKDVLNLIKIIQDKVYEQTGEKLEMEIRIIPFKGV